MSKIRRKHSAEFKLKVVLETLKGVDTLSAIASNFSVHPTQITKWKREFVERAPEIFAENSGRSRKDKEKEQVEEALYKKVGELQMELDWLKKKSGISLYTIRGIW